MRTLLRKSRFPAGGAAWLIAALSLTPAGAHTVNVSSVNVLSGPGTQYAVVTRLTLGTQVMIASTSNGWSNVTSPAKGWVASTYLKDRPHLTLPNAWGAVQSRPAAFQFPPCVNLKGSSVVIRWRTATNTRGTVAYGTTTAYGKIAASSTPAQYHRVQLDGLAAATRYYYRVSIVGTTASMKGTFTTPGLTKIRAVYLAETHFPSQAAYTREFASIIRQFSPHLLIESGDMVDTGGSFSNWVSYMQGSAAWLPNAILLPCYSNHTFQGMTGGGSNPYMAAAFSLPNNERWYSTRYGPLQNITLDSTYEVNPILSTTQVTWLRDTVRAAHNGVGDPMFTTVAWHYPAYSSGPDSREAQRKWARSHFVSTINTNGGCDLIAVGHDRFNERSVINGLNHVQTTMGKAMETLENYNAYKVFRDTTYRMTLLVEADQSARTLTGWLVTPAGKIHDSFQVRK